MYYKANLERKIKIGKKVTSPLHSDQDMSSLVPHKLLSSL